MYEILEYLIILVDFMLYDSWWILYSACFVVFGEIVKLIGRLGVFKLSDSGVILVCEIEWDSGFKCCIFGSYMFLEWFIVIGSLSGEFETWDFEYASESRSSFKVYCGVVNVIDGIGGGIYGIGVLEIVIGGWDGIVKVWDMR